MSIADWWSQLAGAECLECGGPHSVFARRCPHCNAVNAARTGAIAIVAALGFLVIAIVIASVMVVRWQRLAAAPEAGAPAAPPDEFGWLMSAMAECDAQAQKEQATLQFLIIPLAADKKDEADWRAKSLNDIGHGILLNSDTALEGLRHKTLRIADGDYIFSIRDQKNATYSWKRSAGVASFSVANADAIENFHIQFQLGKNPPDAEWGATFVRRRGNCYWVNAIVAE
jgi:hypothetical protein